ncbi:MAG: DUF6115 domain-containing protein [Acidobacteriota bacterium]
MEFLSNLFGDQSSGLFQIVLDLVLVVVFIVTMVLNRRPQKGAVGAPGTEELTRALEAIVQETQNIAKDFDTNLQERQAIIQQLFIRLDQRIRDAQALCKQLEELSNRPPPREPQGLHRLAVQPQPATPVTSEHQKVLALARKGLDAEAIAKRLQKPVGEVELILNLQRLSSGR